MKKYGLQLRVPPQQKKQPTKPLLPKASAFNEEDDDDVEREILRQAYKSKTHKDVEEQHKKALEEDPSVFDYDGVYDEMKEKQVRPKQQDHQERKPRYIEALINKAKQREREHEIIYERKLAKERSQDEHLYADKDKYVTSAYKKKLAEQAKWLEEERLRELKEESEDVTKKKDITDFYFNLSKNVAFGASGETSSKKPETEKENAAKHSSEKAASQATEKRASQEPSMPIESHKEVTEINDLSPKHEPEAAKPEPTNEAAPLQDQVEEKPLASEEPKADDHHKRSVDSVAAAKERFLARKKAKKEQI